MRHKLNLVTIRENKALILKICKFIGYFLLLIGLAYQIQRLYKKLKVEPEIFSKESSIQSSEIPFPAVTICPPFTVKTKAWNSEFLMPKNLTEDDLTNASHQICPNQGTANVSSSNSNVVDVLLKTSFTFDEIIHSCKIGKHLMRFEDCEKLFVKSLTDYGICYTFNMFGHDSIFNQRISSDFDTFKNTLQPQWTLEAGYVSDLDDIQPVRALKMQTLTFEGINVIGENFCDERDKKFKVLLHLPNEMPQLSSLTVNAESSFESAAFVSAEMTQNDDSLRNFSPDTRGCYFEGEKPLKFLKSYTKANCEYECMTNFVNLSCGCVKFSMLRSQDIKVCGNDDLDCIKEITDIFPRSYYDNHENKKKFPNYPCGCLPSCTEIRYKVVRKEEEFSRHSGINAGSYTHTAIKVIFTDSQIPKISNYVTYDMENFIFDIGGLVGLFLGSSILSMLELLITVCKSIKMYAGIIPKGSKFILKTKKERTANPQAIQPATISAIVIQVDNENENDQHESRVNLNDGNLSESNNIDVLLDEIQVVDL